MRILLNWKNRGEEVISRLNEKHEVIYWIGLPEETENKISGVIFHNKRSAQAGIPAESVDMSSFSPPSKSLIESMYKTESIMLTMMNRRFTTLSVNERKHTYYNMLGYWYGVLKKYTPDVLIFDDTPHSSYNYVLYELAKILDIRTIILRKVRISDRFLMSDDWRMGSESLKERVKKNKDKAFTTNDLSYDIKEFYISQTNPKLTPMSAQIESSYVNFWKKSNSRKTRVSRSVKVLAANFKHGTFFQYLINKLRIDLTKKIKQEYETLQKIANFSTPFVYLPLHFQPERSTSPEGDMFVDQILVAEIISNSLPAGWKIYAKEHPMQWRSRGSKGITGRYVGYYEKLASIKNIELVPPKTSTFELIKNAMAVATVTGNAGFEAALRLKPVLLFGHPWYGDCPFAFHTGSVSSCKEVFNKIQNNSIKENRQDIINYLKSFDEASIHGYIGIKTFLGTKSKLNKKESMDKILEKILFEIESTKNH